LECLSGTRSSIEVDLRAKLYKFSAVYALLVFQSLLSVTKGLCKLLRKETLDLVEALICKQAVCDTVKGKHTDGFTTELHERIKALCHTHSIGGYQILCWRKLQVSHTELNNSRIEKRVTFPLCG